MVMLVGGALLNTAYLVVGNDYSVSMDASWFPWMTETWRAVVRPNHDLLISLLILFEAAVGVLILSGGAHDAARACLCDRVPSRTMRDGLGATLYALAMLAGLVLLLRAVRRAASAQARPQQKPPVQIRS